MIAGKNVARIAAGRRAGRETTDARAAVSMSVWKFVLGRGRRRGRRGGVHWFSDNFLRHRGRRGPDQTPARALTVDEDGASFLVLLLDFNHFLAEPES